MRWSTLLVLLAASAACQGSSSRPDAEPPDDDVGAEEAELSSAGHILFLNFEGGEVARAIPPFFGERTEPPTAYQVARATTFAPWSASFFEASMDRAEVIRRVAARVRAILAPYDVSVVTRKPAASRDYAMLMIPADGGEQLNRSGTGLSTLYGISTLDCDDSNPQAVGFVFPDAILLNEQGTLVAEGSPEKAIDAIAAVAAHEYGHTLGLKDTKNESDVMYPYGGTAGAYGPRSEVEDVSGHVFELCGDERTQDSHAMVLAALGPRR